MPLLTVDQAAERLGTSPRFIRRLVAERRIAFAKLGKHVRIDSADLDAFVAAGRVAPAVPASVPESRDSTSPRERLLRRAAGQS
jgi:excisionase family DNA binding protein